MPYALDFFHSAMYRSHITIFCNKKTYFYNAAFFFQYPQTPNNIYKLEQAGIAQIPTLMNSVLTPIAHSHVQRP
jgi:hypothetical protein